MYDTRMIGNNGFFDKKASKIPADKSSSSILPNTCTRFATLGLSNTIIIGNVISTAIAVEESIVTVTTIGIGLMNSPIIPVLSNNGTNDQIVVIVVDQIGTIVSRQTNKPVCCGVNLPVL